MTELKLPLNHLPDSLAEQVDQYWQRFYQSHCSDNSPEARDYRDSLLQCLGDEVVARQLTCTWAGSQYAAELCMRQPQLFRQLLLTGLLQRRDDVGDIELRVQAATQGELDSDEFNARLRRCRAQEMFRLIWRDLNRLADLDETIRDISSLAQAAIQSALNFHHRQLCTELGEPSALINDQWVPQSMLVLGMGKLGANELNLSSDIDLIFAYPQNGETVGGPRVLDNQEFFTRLGRRLIQSLDPMTADGFVFRVDMRLRPYGQSGALVLSFDAMEEYYQDQGRDWERYAMVKARVVAGDPEQATCLMTLLKPFVYRRYTDFSAIESLRSMKQMIQQEVQRRHLQNDVKLGAGGIREIEFIAQSFQLIRGGREPQLQERRVQIVLEILADSEYLPADVCAELQQAYVFLRNTEHAIQAYNDRQTQALPTEALAQTALAFSMGFDDWDCFVLALDQHRQRVSRHFQQVVSDHEDPQTGCQVEGQWVRLWGAELSEEVALALLQSAGHEDAAAVLARLSSMREETSVQRMQPVGRERLDQFMPRLLQALEKDGQPSATLLRILPLVESVLRRTAYLVLLVENPQALQQLVILCAASNTVASQLARHPVLLDELLDTRTLYTVPEINQLRDELQQQMLRVALDDLEGHMEGLRYFKQAHQLRASAAEVTGKLSLMKVSDYLTMIAEVILSHVLELCWHDLEEKHGRPQREPGVPCEQDFIVVGYGKAGGIELGHSSDLDLVFIHDLAANLPTDGERSVDNSVFINRLGQRIIHILTARTALGQLYEVDMRLRPSGASGLLVSSIAAFAKYQENEAWTWEHQALVRARVLAGDHGLASAFVALRRRLLCQKRDSQSLREDVKVMRQKMRDHLLPKGLEEGEIPIFHLKHGVGAIVDIEFMVQYAVLAWSHQYPILADYTDNIRILETLQQLGLFSKADAQALIDAYKAYRARAHRLSLLQLPSEVPMNEFEQQRQLVMAKWSELLV